MGAVCGRWARPEVEVDMAPLYEANYVSEGNKELEEKALRSAEKMSEAEWNIIMTKGASGWRMQLPPPPQPEGTNDADCKSGRVAAEKCERKKNFRESVAMAIAPNVNLVVALQHQRCTPGCEVDILHEGCCTVRFDTLAPQFMEAAEEVEKTAEQGENISQLSPTDVQTQVPYGGDNCDEPKKQNNRKPHNIKPKPIVLQSTLPLPPQSELYFEVEFISLQSSLMKAQTWSDISHVTVGVAPRPYPQQHLPGVLLHSCSISTTGAIHVGTPEPVMEVDPLIEGDVLGVLLCRRSGTVLFLLNGAPLKSVACKDILFCETDPSTFTAPAGSAVERQPPPGPDMYVTLGFIGRGECEVNFGGKSYTAHGYIRDIGGGIIQSNAPIQARAFGQRLANFSQMLAELQLFYQIYCPHMLPKAKGMVVMNVSRREAFEAELAANYGKSLKDVRGIVEDVLRRRLYNFLAEHDPPRLLEVDKILQETKGEIERINALLMRVYHANLNGVSLRRKQSIGRMLREYHTLHKVDLEATKLDRLAEQALNNPGAADSFLREKYGRGINILLQKRLEQIYEAYAPENRAEIGLLIQKYPLFDDEFHMACKLKVKYNLDLYMFSPLEEDKKELAAIRRNLRPAKMSKQLKLLEADDMRNASMGFTHEEGNKTTNPSVRTKSRNSVDARERKSIRRASRATADMAAAVAAATAAAHAAESAAQAAADAAANVKEQGLNREKMHEERIKRRRDRDDRRKSRLDKEALRDLLEMQLKQHASEEEATELQLSHSGVQQSEETQQLLTQKQKMQQKKTEIEEKKKQVESALKVPDEEWWAAMKQQEEQSDEEWEALEKHQQQQQQAEQELLPDNKSPPEEKQSIGGATAADAKHQVKPEATNTANSRAQSPANVEETRKSVRLTDAGLKPVQTGAAHLPKGTIGGRPASTKNSAPTGNLKTLSAAASAAAAVATSSKARAAAVTERGSGCSTDGKRSDAKSEKREDGQQGIKGARERRTDGAGQLHASDESVAEQHAETPSLEKDTLRLTEERELEENRHEHAKEPSQDSKNVRSEVPTVAGASISGATAGDFALGGTEGRGKEGKRENATTPGAREDSAKSERHLLSTEVVHEGRKESESVTDTNRLNELDDGSSTKAHVSFAASTPNNGISTKGRAADKQAVAGEAKSLVDNIVRRSSVKASDACAAVLPRHSAA